MISSFDENFRKSWENAWLAWQTYILLVHKIQELEWMDECFDEEQHTPLYTAQHYHTLHDTEGKHRTNIVTSRATQGGKRLGKP